VKKSRALASPSDATNSREASGVSRKYAAKVGLTATSWLGALTTRVRCIPRRSSKVVQGVAGGPSHAAKFGMTALGTDLYTVSQGVAASTSSPESGAPPSAL